MKIILISLLMFLATGYANPSDALYEVKLESSASQSEEPDLKNALQIVVNRLTPGVNDPDNPVIQTTNPEPLLESDEVFSQGDKRIRHIRFKPEAIHQLMNRAGQQPWIKTRPKLLTWVFVVSERGNKHQFIDIKQHPTIAAALEESAKEKGLQLVYPELDSMKDLTQKLSRNAWPKVTELAQESKSLHPEGVLLVKLSMNDKPIVWEHWQAYYRGRSAGGEDTKRTRSERVGRYAMHGVSQFLFEQGEQKKITPRSVYVRISHIETADDYDRIRHYLGHIPGVKLHHNSVNSVTYDAVLYTLDITIPASLLDARLSQKYTPLPGDVEEGIMNYRLKT